MAFSSYGDFNKRTDVPLTITYSFFEDNPNLLLSEYQQGFMRTWWRITRRARKTYTYVGLTKEAARKCAEEKTRMYTRPFVFWGFINGRWGMRYHNSFIKTRPVWANADKYLDLVASITITRNGPVYNVQIDVDESVVIYKHMTPPRVPLTTNVLEGYFASPDLSAVNTRKDIFTYDE